MISGTRRAQIEEAFRPTRARVAAGVALFAIGIVLGSCEARTSAFQAGLGSALARRATWTLAPGCSDDIRFPAAGPYDQRHGYARIATFRERLEARGFECEAQVRFSPTLRALAALGMPPPWREPPRAGLRVEDRRGDVLFDAHDGSGYASFSAVPPLVAQSLLYVENRELLRDVHPNRNPVLEWDRLGRAGIAYFREKIGGGSAAAGGSTLAIQIEKFRHSPGGLTESPFEKLRQIAAASLRAYRLGPRTGEVRRDLVVDYLDSLPLAALPGHGEVLGMREGLEAWYGVDFEEANRRIRALPARGPVDPAGALAYAQTLSLILATQRPTDYLMQTPQRLAARMDHYLTLLARDGVISAELRAAAAAAPLVRRRKAPPAPDRAIERKSAGPVRARMVEMLGMNGYPELDALDLRVESSLDERSQLRAAGKLRELRDAKAAEAAGLTGFRLLAPGRSEGVVYSFSLYEIGLGANRLLVQTDNSPSALDVAEGAKLDLGSTAKLRTLIAYLEAIAALHGELASRKPAELKALPVHPKDRLTAWVKGELLASPGIPLAALLDRALLRRYSASPGEAFLTGGGLHRFANFDHRDDGKVVTLKEAFRNSINLPFIRLMRDLVDHLISRTPGGGRNALEDRTDPRRQTYLTRFVERESRTFLRQFYGRYRGLSREEAIARLFATKKLTPKRVAVVLRTQDPEAGYDAFAAEMARRLGPKLPDRETLAAFHATYGPDRLALADRGYLAGVHPLELWLVGWLAAHPEATFDEALEASQTERIEVYRWLFRSKHKAAQDKRIRSELERDAFAEIHEQWRLTGYPFDSLVPSYATAIGTSADRPSALAELAGILLNDGVRQPTRRLERIAFAETTPYETRLVPVQRAKQRVLQSEVAAAVRGALLDVVEGGTARRAGGSIKAPDGRPLAIGGKTGTGDHRYKTFGAGGRLLESRVVSRTATFVFTIENRFYGVVTAHVTGPSAARFSFTSSLPVQMFKVLAPAVVTPLLGEEALPETALRGELRD